MVVERLMVVAERLMVVAEAACMSVGKQRAKLCFNLQAGDDCSSLVAPADLALETPSDQHGSSDLD